MVMSIGESKCSLITDCYIVIIYRYDYNDLCTDVTKFPRPRFASEFGFQSYPSFETMKGISIAQVCNSLFALIHFSCLSVGLG